MTMNSKKLMPVFENGMAQPVFPFTDGKTGAAYDAKTSDIVRFCVYVEANFDTNGDGKGDLIKAFVQVPRSAAEGNYKAASVFEARPYCAGVNADGYDHMKEVEGNACPGPDSMKINYFPEPGNSILHKFFCICPLICFVIRPPAGKQCNDKSSVITF